jgi:nucleoside-diphosphate-sugar epimerase
MKALVTGSTGFIGSHLVEALLKRGYKIFCSVRRSSDRVWLKHLDVTFVDADITERDSLIPAVSVVDYVFHLGGITKAKKESAYSKINADGSRVLYEVCQEHNPHIRKIVHVSSLAAAGPSEFGRPRCESDPPNPLTFYGKSKLEGERYATEYMKTLPITIIRPPAVYGPKEKDILFYFRLMKYHLRPILGFSEKHLSMVYVDDLVEAIILAAESPASVGQTYFVDDGRIYTWQELSRVIQQSLGTWSLPVVIPEPLIAAVAYAAEFFSQFSRNPALLNRQKVIELRQKAWTCSSEKIRKELGFESRFPLEAGCKATVQWYREHRWL